MCVAGRAAKNRLWHHLPVNKRQNSIPAALQILYRCVLQCMRGFFAGVEMRSKRVWVMGSFFFAAALLVLMLPPGARLNAKQAAAQSEEPVPAYHAQPPTEALPETVDPISSLATATATVPTVTPACLIVSRAPTVQYAMSAWERRSTPMNRRAWGRLLRRSAKVSNAVTGNTSILRNTRNTL